MVVLVDDDWWAGPRRCGQAACAMRKFCCKQICRSPKSLLPKTPSASSCAHRLTTKSASYRREHLRPWWMRRYVTSGSHRLKHVFQANMMSELYCMCSQCTFPVHSGAGASARQAGHATMRLVLCPVL